MSRIARNSVNGRLNRNTFCSGAEVVPVQCKRGLDLVGMEWNGMEWNGMEWNGMEWNGMDWSGMEWNGME